MTTTTDATTPCRTCSAPLAADQRYCLNCGLLRGEVRLPADEVFDEIVRGREGPRPGASVPDAPAAAPAVAAAPHDRTALAVLVIAAIILPSFGLGLLLGGRGDDVTVPAPQVITVGAAAATPVAAAATVADTWPVGREGWTVQLQALPKASTQPAAVQAAATDARAKGAAAVGTLDSDAHPSLPGGDYVVFSGVYDTKAAATDALAELQDAFPDAAVVRVGGAAAGAAKQKKAATSKEDVDTTGVPEAPAAKNLSTKEFQKRSKQLPKTTGTGGAPPPTDDEAPGGGSEEEAVSIG